jgi:DNA modification methylase
MPDMGNAGCWHPDMPQEYRNTVVVGDARELARRIPDASIDLIFTDPPYLKKHLGLYGWLAREAARVLKPGGFLLAMCGGSYLNQIFRAMDENLTYFWKYEISLPGWATGMVWTKAFPKTTIVVRDKPVLAYSRGPPVPRTSTVSMFSATGSDKRYHVWGQDEASTRYYVDCFSAVGDVVLDPFCGGGTTAAMCKRLQREFVTFEIDAGAAESASIRLADVQPYLPGLLEQQSTMELTA